ncbi:MAG: hypothetical protein FWF08_02445 [Oscillospiraceae bacterium]|nr:hypothetical protein [Oscillospiraceae bacterium]
MPNKELLILGKALKALLDLDAIAEVKEIVNIMADEKMPVQETEKEQQDKEVL